MAKFKIEITETLQKVVEIEGDSLSKAITQAVDKYRRGEIEVSPEDIKETAIRQYGGCENWTNKTVRLY